MTRRTLEHDVGVVVSCAVAAEHSRQQLVPSTRTDTRNIMASASPCTSTKWCRVSVPASKKLSLPNTCGAAAPLSTSATSLPDQIQIQKGSLT